MPSFRIIFLFLMINNVYGQTKETAADLCALTIPDKLNRNDNLIVSCPCDVSSFHFELYSRFGKQVYLTDSLTSPLNIVLTEKIITQGKEIFKYPDGMYYWLAKYSPANLQEKELKGYLQLLTDGSKKRKHP